MDKSCDRTKMNIVTAPGFAYDISKGVLLAGSIVSRAIHPLADVESLKSKLIDSGALEARRSNGRIEFYECTQDIQTGPLMAYNLHSGKLELDMPECDVPYAEGSDELISINEALKLWAVYSPDPEFRAKMERDSYRVIKFIEATYDPTFVNGKGDGSLSKVEQFVVDALLAAGEIDVFRRGDALQHECDIVDDARSRQIEFVSLFDEKVPPRIRYANELNEEQALILEYYDFGYNIVATGVINKFTLKNYTDRYSKELAIYMLGPNREAADKVDTLERILSARINEIKNNYTRIHIILHDPLVDETFVYCANDRFETYPDSLCSVNIVERKPADPDNMEPGKSYLIIKQNIFDPEIRSMQWIKSADGTAI